jgi:HWE histidine kinase
LIDVSLTISPVRNARGKIIGASKIARDITERKRNEAQIVNLAREAEHRAKNALATVQATARLSNSDTPEGLKRAIEGRIQALASVHRLFVETRWTGAELVALHGKGDFFAGPSSVTNLRLNGSVFVFALATNASHRRFWPASSYMGDPAVPHLSSGTARVQKCSILKGREFKTIRWG